MTSRETVATLATTKTFVPPLLPPAIPSTHRAINTATPTTCRTVKVVVRCVRLIPWGARTSADRQLQCSQPLGGRRPVCPTPEAGITNGGPLAATNGAPMLWRCRLLADHFWRDFWWQPAMWSRTHDSSRHTDICPTQRHLP